jgi:hypothetical protein
MNNLEQAARQALAALVASHGELDIRLASHDERLSKNKKAIKELRKALEQPKQEPVAWADMDVRKVITPPAPQAPRAWVGLTEEKITDVAQHYTEVEGFVHGARWAEDELKEKNT